MHSATLNWITPDAQGVIVNNARVSSDPEVASGPDDRLLRYCVKHWHWSIFEQANMCVTISTTRDIGRQILRHRSFHFQEFCISGDSEITLELPGAAVKGKRSAYKRTIEHLYNLQESGKKMPSMVRVFDEATKTFVNAGIKEVFKTGVKPLFKVTLENGRSITATKEHKFLTESGFSDMETALGLSLVGNTATWTNRDASFACNGIESYKSKDWLQEQKDLAIKSGNGLAGIAAAAGVTTHTVRKWLSVHGIQFTKNEVASYTSIWNKGKKWVRGKHSMETIEKMRKSARRGQASNLWRGGVDRPFRLAVTDWCNALRSEFLKEANYYCSKCHSNDRLELHHTTPVCEDPSVAMEKSNIEVLCFSCHRSHHGTLGHHKSWREKSKGNTLTTHWSKVRSVEYVGEHMTYDMEVQHSSHNYVANGIVTHNSQRYADVSILGDAVLREARMQHPTNRQMSLECEDVEIADWWELAQKHIASHSADIYDNALESGIAKEVARAILPEGLTPSKMHMNGTIRDWIHFIAVRSDPTAQKEVRMVANSIDEIFRREMPVIWEAVQK